MLQCLNLHIKVETVELRRNYTYIYMYIRAWDSVVVKALRY